MSFLEAHWRTAAFHGRCAKCRCNFRRGARIVYSPRTRATYCQRETCGPRVMAPIEAAALTEARALRLAHELAQRERELYPNFEEAA